MIKILEGDCLGLFQQVDDGTVDLIVSDPPYNVYDNETVKMTFQRRKKEVDWDRFDQGFIDFSLKWIDISIQKLKPNGSIFIFGGVNYVKGNDLLALISILRERLHFINMIVWYYHNGLGAHRFFSNRYELVALFAKGRDYKFNLDAVRIKYDAKTLEEYIKDKRVHPENIIKGKNPTNVWEIGRINANSHERLEHPTQKPEEIIKRIILATTDENDLVVDPFLGSGTTAKVCQDLQRKCIGFEIDPRYYKMAIARCSLPNHQQANTEREERP